MAVLGNKSNTAVSLYEERVFGIIMFIVDMAFDPYNI